MLDNSASCVLIYSALAIFKGCVQGDGIGAVLRERGIGVSLAGVARRFFGDSRTADASARSSE